MLIDCDTCVARGLTCGDCVVSVFLHISSARPPSLDGGGAANTGIAAVGSGVRRGMRLDDDERAAVASLAAAGLVPPLRLVRPVASGLPGHAEGVA